MRGGIWALIFLLVLNTVIAQNLGFEDGLNLWDSSYSPSSQNYQSMATNSWNSEGNRSLFFAGASNGMFPNNGHRATIAHTVFEVMQGDQICVDLRKENGPTSYRFESSIGVFLPGIQSRVYNTTCKISDGNYKLNFSIVGTSSSGCSGDCQARIFLDNIRIFSCADGAKNQNETDVDCGSWCGPCTLGKSCAIHSDCSSFFCLENNTCAQPRSFNHMLNYNFEIGSDDYWKYNHTSGGQDYTPSVTQYWRNEGNHSLAVPRISTGMHVFSGHSATFYHNQTLLEAGDEVCFNMKKNSSSLSRWRVDLISGGEVFSSVSNGEYIHVCENSTGNGSLGIKVSGTENIACNVGVQCFARFFFDNISVNANRCDNGILDHFETDTDCGGFCGKCSSSEACLYDFDCENDDCIDGFCGGFTEESLLEKYAPVLYFHPDEQFFPTSIDAMLNESDLFRSSFGFDEEMGQSPISMEFLSAPDVDSSYYLNMINASGGAIGTSPNPTRFDIYSRTVYGREFEPDALHIVLQYWFFYPYNDFRGGHEGDWEMIQLILNKNTTEPLSATYSYHYDARTYDWSEVSKVNETHPKVFVALGGHASYKDPVSIWQHRSVTLEQVAEENDSFNLPLLINSIGESPQWPYYLGRWGEFLNNDSTYNGPRSPAFIAYSNQVIRWDEPLEFAQDSRPSEQSAVTGSPVNLHAYDKYGNHVGLNESGEIEIEIPNTYLYIPSNDSKEIIIILTDEEISYVIEGTSPGAFNLTILNYDKTSRTETNISYRDIPVNKSTIAQVNLTLTNPNYVMLIEDNGDGIFDETALPFALNTNGAETNPEVDSDNDGFSDSTDNCPQLYNPNQETDLDNDGFDNLLCYGNDCNDNDNLINPIQEESCNNVDDNCNSEIDEDLIRICGLTDIGICTFGEESCVSGNWEDCSAVFPQLELCNDLDDDCNFNVDDGFNVNDSCSLGTGECKAEGFFVCSTDNRSSICNAILNEPTIELCDEKDNDCNEVIDDNCAINSKNQAITILENEKTGSCPRKGVCKDKLIEEIVGNIRKSLNPSYFTNKETLSESGLNVFKYESQAVLLCSRMEKLIGIEEACQGAITLMKAADKRFAENALEHARSLTIRDPRNQGCYDRRIKTAELYIRNAEDFITKYFPNMVIDRYGLAWKSAQEAVKFANSVKDIC